MTSVYELTTPLGAERKQRFWDYFDGNGLRNWWTETDVAGGGTWAMLDEINGGVRCTTSTTSSSRSIQHFNDIEQFDNTSSVFICEMRRNTANTFTHCGLQYNVVASNGTDDRYLLQDTSGGTKKSMYSQDNSGTVTDSSVDIDTNWTTYKGEAVGSTVLKGWINGSFEIAKTDQFPQFALQPALRMGNLSTNAAEADYRYFEAYNT